MSEIPSYLRHHVKTFRYFAEEPGSLEERADKLMRDLADDPRYPQTPEFKEAIMQAIRDFEKGEYKVVDDGLGLWRVDRLCRLCRSCFLGDRSE